MTTYLKPPSPEQDAQFADWEAKFETVYSDFYQIPDIVLALEKAQKVGVPLNALKVKIGLDLRNRKRMIDYEDTWRTSTTDETQKQARKVLRTVESVISEIEGLPWQFEEAMQRAISDLKGFSADHIASDEYRSALSCFLADTPTNLQDAPPMNEQKILGALSIEEATSVSLYLLDKIREELICQQE